MFKKNIGIVLPVLILFSCVLIANAKNETMPRDGTVIALPDSEEPVNRFFSLDEIDNSGRPLKASSTYTYLGVKRYWGLVRYYDYYVYKNNSNPHKLNLNKNLTDAVYHEKNKSQWSFSFTKSATYLSQYASSFSTSAGFAAESGDMVNASVDFGYGRTYTQGRSYAASSTIQATIPNYANTGFYKMGVCHNYYLMKIIQKRTDGSNAVERIMAIPYYEPYAAVLYSTNLSSWQFYG